MDIDVNVEELKLAAPIIPYVKTFYNDKIKIEKETENTAVCKCIWHNENTASLTFFANGTYKCFGCGEHGDVITLVQKIDDLDFISACVKIANNVGYKINYINTNPAWETYKDNMDELSRRYWTNLQRDADALNYLYNVRGLTQESINEFRLGLTDNEEYKYRQDMENISHKLTFPILEHKRIHPKCIGMAYRGFDNSKPKYINDKNQIGCRNQDEALKGVFVKGNMLYGLAQAYQEIYKQKFVFICEGYFDTILMHQYGLKNTVSVMGTAISDSQIQTLYNITHNVVMFLDSDDAGINAMKRYIPVFVAKGFNVKICTLNAYKDPDEMCRLLHNKNVISYEINSHVQDAIQFVIDERLIPYKIMVSNERDKVLNDLKGLFNAMPDNYMKNCYWEVLKKELF